MKLCDFCQKVEIEDNVSYCGSCSARIIKMGILLQSLKVKPEEAEKAFEDIKKEQNMTCKIRQMPEFVVMVGLSGSGKTTIAKEKYATHIYISSDDLRAELYGDVNDQRHNGKIFEEMFKRSADALEEGQSVVYDATNLSAKRRKSLINNMRAAIRGNFWAVACVVLTTYENCLIRNALRDRVVPEDVIRRQFLTFQCPTEHEGFDSIHLEHTESYENRVSYICNCMKSMAKMNHDNPHHPDTIFEHSVNVMKTMMEAAPPFDCTSLYGQTGFYHDVGKLYTKFFDDNGIAHFNNHDAPSAYISLLAPDGPLQDQEKIVMAAAIGWHMKEYSYQTEEGYKTWLDTLIPEYRDLLMALNRADRINSVA